MSFSNEKESHSSDHAIGGAVSGFLTRFLCQPLDVIKIRLQLQVEPIKHEHPSKYRSLLHATDLILKEEGIFALWKGHVPAQYLSIIYGMSQFYTYDIIMKYSNRFPILDNWKNSMHFIAGAGAGCIATIVSFPFDTIRTRLIAQSSKHRVYHGMLHSCSSILWKESPKIFFYGLTPTLLQIGPHTGLQFLFYEICTDAYKKYFHNSYINVYNSVIAGSVAGFTAKTIVYPFDLARKRLQIQGFEKGRKGFGQHFMCNGLIDCIRVTIVQEGFSGLFKGLVPSQLKAALTTSLYFTFYQQTVLLLEHLR